MVFHPNFQNNGRLYIWYSLEVDGKEYARMSEVKVLLSNPNRVDPASHRVLFDIEQPFTNNNGGDVSIKWSLLNCYMHLLEQCRLNNFCF